MSAPERTQPETQPEALVSLMDHDKAYFEIRYAMLALFHDDDSKLHAEADEYSLWFYDGFGDTSGEAQLISSIQLYNIDATETQAAVDLFVWAARSAAMFHRIPLHQHHLRSLPCAVCGFQLPGG